MTGGRRNPSRSPSSAAGPARARQPGEAGAPPGFVRLKMDYPVPESGRPKTPRIPSIAGKIGEQGRDCGADSLSRSPRLTITERISYLAIRAFRFSLPTVCWAVTAYGGVKHPEVSGQQLVLEVLSSRRVREAVEGHAQATGMSVAEGSALAARLIRGMAADLTVTAVRFLGWILSYAWGWLYSGDIFIDQDGLERVRERAHSHTIVYVPTHKSHMDYLLLSYLLFANQLPVPHIAAGDNLNLPLVGPLLRRSGAFFIRRQIKGTSDGEVYKAVMAEYVAALLRNGHTMEFFIEGGRSRDGRVIPPRLGLLALVVDAAIAGGAGGGGTGSQKPVCLVPLSVTYDSAVEERGLLAEMMGARKQKESLQSLMQAAVRILRKRHGRVMVSFEEPLMVDDYLRAAAAPDGPDSRRVVQELGRDVTARMRLAAVPTLTSLLAAALLFGCSVAGGGEGGSEGDSSEEGERRAGGEGARGGGGCTGRRWVPQGAVLEQMRWVRAEVATRGGRVASGEDWGKALPEVEKSVALLVDSGALERRAVAGMAGCTWEVRPRAGPQARLVLRYHVNLLLHWFTAEGIVVAALVAATRGRHPAGGGGGGEGQSPRQCPAGKPPLPPGPATPSRARAAGAGAGAAAGPAGPAREGAPLGEVLAEATWLRELLESEVSSLLGEWVPSAWRQAQEAAMARLQRSGAVHVTGAGGDLWVAPGQDPSGVRAAVFSLRAMLPIIRSYMVAARALDGLLNPPVVLTAGVEERDVLAALHRALAQDSEATGKCAGAPGDGDEGLAGALGRGPWAELGCENALVSRALPSVPLARGAIREMERRAALARAPPEPPAAPAELPLSPSGADSPSAARLGLKGGGGGGAGAGASPPLRSGRALGRASAHPSIGDLPTVASYEQLPLLAAEAAEEEAEGEVEAGAPEAAGRGRGGERVDVLWPGLEYRRSGGAQIAGIADRLQAACQVA